MSDRGMDTPIMITDVFAPMLRMGAFVTGCQLGLYKLLSDGPLSAAAIAEAVGTDPYGTGILLDVLSNEGYLVRVPEGFANSPRVDAWLGSDSDIDFTSSVLWVGTTVWDTMRMLEGNLRRGKPEKTLWERMDGDPQAGQLFAQHMKALAEFNADAVTAHVPVPEGATRMLDIGGSHGFHSISMCVRHPNLNAVIFDLPEAQVEAQSNIDKQGYGDRIEMRCGDYLTDDIGGDYDLVLCFMVLNNRSNEDSRRLIAKSAQALKPGGLFVVHDYVRDPPPQGFKDAFNLFLWMLHATVPKSMEELDEWGAEVGLSKFERIDMDTHLGTLAIARRLD